MKEIKHIIKDELGIHARPAGLLVKAVAGFSGEVRVGTPQKMVDGKRIFGIMNLGLKCGDEITLTFDGIDEDVTAEKILLFLNENL
ncbi:MAG: HPr family phosphocarrier protein [Oscillospiraceae bacterium]|nr:HPr family phosphocarrier protein [Oscillospiraceae bacterium]